MAAGSREHFIPVSRYALLEHLRRQAPWNNEERQSREAFFQYLAIWTHQSFRQDLNALKRAFLPFSPDRDTKTILDYSDRERASLQAELLASLRSLLEHANYNEITSRDLQQIFSADSPYGLQLKVDLSEFEEVLLYARGHDTAARTFRDWKKLYLKKLSIEIPVYQRLFLLLKLKPEALRIDEIMTAENVSRKKAQKKLNRYRENLPDNISGDHIIIKLFKNIPQADLEMLFPNTQVRLKPFDKIKLGITAGGGTIGSVTATATKLAAAANPMTAATAMAGLAGVIFRQVMKFFGQRTKYMMVLAQNLYFHNLANNRAALTLLTDRAEEEAFKNTLLAYHILNQNGPLDSCEQLSQQVEAFIKSEFNTQIEFDVEAALDYLDNAKLLDRENLSVVTPGQASQQLQRHWQQHMETLPSPDGGNGSELEA